MSEYNHDADTNMPRLIHWLMAIAILALLTLVVPVFAAFT